MGGEAPILVVTCGNAMAGDDALGPAVGAALRRMALPGVEVVDLDMKPAALLDQLTRPLRLLVVVDAVAAAGIPSATVVELDWREPQRAELIHDDVLSCHGLSIARQIELADKLEMLPRNVRLIGAVIDLAGVGDGVSRAFGCAVDAIARRIAVLARTFAPEYCNA